VAITSIGHKFCNMLFLSYGGELLAQPARCRFNGGLHNYTLYRVFLDDRIKDNELGGACSVRRLARNSYKILVGKSERKKHTEDLDVDGRIILKRSWCNGIGVCGFHSSGSGQGPLPGFCEHGNEPSCSAKGG
jgi:hypothetical protein